MLMRLRMLKLSIGKGRQVIKQLCCIVAVLRYSGYRARGVCALQSSSFVWYLLMPPPQQNTVVQDIVIYNYHFSSVVLFNVCMYVCIIFIIMYVILWNVIIIPTCMPMKLSDLQTKRLVSKHN